MKKIFLSIIFFILSISSLNANRDIAQNISYKGSVKLEDSIKYDIDNKSCRGSTYSSNKILDLFSPDNGCTLKGDELSCDKVISVPDLCREDYDGVDDFVECKAPPSTHNITVNLSADGGQIMDRLNIPKDIRKYISPGRVTRSVNMTLYLATGPIPAFNSNDTVKLNSGINISAGSYSYDDKGECPDYEYVESETCDKNGENCKITTEKVMVPYDEPTYNSGNFGGSGVSGASGGGDNTGGNIGGSNISSTGSSSGRVSGVGYEDLKFPGVNCTKISQAEYSCYATDQNIDFGMGVQSFGSFPTGTALVSINNAENTESISNIIVGTAMKKISNGRSYNGSCNINNIDDKELKKKLDKDINKEKKEISELEKKLGSLKIERENLQKEREKLQEENIKLNNEYEKNTDETINIIKEENSLKRERDNLLKSGGVLSRDLLERIKNNKNILEESIKKNTYIEKNILNLELRFKSKVEEIKKIDIEINSINKKIDVRKEKCFVLNEGEIKSLGNSGNVTGQHIAVSVNNGIFTKVGTYSIVIQMFGNNNAYTQSNLINVRLNIVPNPNYLETKNTDVPKNTIAGEIYANAINSYKYNVTLKDKFYNVIKNKEIIDVTCPKTDENCLIDKSNGKKSGIVAEDIENTNEKGEFNFNIVSYVPSKYDGSTPKPVTPILDGNVERWTPDYKKDGNKKAPFKVTSSSSKTFKEPVEFKELLIEGGNLNVSKDQRYKILFDNVGKLNNFKGKDFNNGIIPNIEEAFVFYTNHVFEKFDKKDTIKLKNINNTKEKLEKEKDDFVGFIGNIKATNDDAIKAKKTEGIKLNIEGLKIKYKIGDYLNEYLLRTKDIDTCAVDTTGLVINGKAQAKGKENITSQVSTVANISKAELKKIVDKNAKDLVRNMTSGQKTNGVLYYNKDVTYSEIKDLKKGDTLIVKNGNLFIDKNVEKNIGIVVLADKFVADPKDTNSKGNIFVKKDVSKINAYIYADGGFISAKNLNGEEYTDDELREKRLDLNGTLVSSNTIGGGEPGTDKKSVLPYGVKTGDKKLAERYDLNYVRKHIMKCEKDLKSGEKNYSFKITYNADIQKNTPKVFLNR